MVDFLFPMSGSAAVSAFAGAFPQRFPPGVVVSEQGSTPRFVYGVLEGRVETVVTTGQRESTVELHGPCSLLELWSALGDEPSPHAIRTCARSRLLVIPVDTLRALYDREPSFAREVTSMIVRQVGRAQAALADQKLRSAAERLARWLAETAQPERLGCWVKLPISKQLLASYIGTTPEHLAKGFVQLKDYGVEIRRKEVLVRDIASLRSFAQLDHATRNAA